MDDMNDRYRKPIERNIYRSMVSGNYFVEICHSDGKRLYRGKIRTLAEAQGIRDAFERTHPPKPRGGKPGDRPPRTQTVIYWERIAAGLCGKCGEDQATPGMRSCEPCRRIAYVKSHGTDEGYQPKTPANLKRHARERI